MSYWTMGGLVGWFGVYLLTNPPTHPPTHPLQQATQLQQLVRQHYDSFVRCADGIHWFKNMIAEEVRPPAHPPTHPPTHLPSKFSHLPTHTMYPIYSPTHPSSSRRATRRKEEEEEEERRSASSLPLPPIHKKAHKPSSPPSFNVWIRPSLFVLLV